MRTFLAGLILAAATATLASATLAQQPAPPPPEPPQSAPQQPAVPSPDQQQDAPEVSESQLETFTTIYVDMQVLNEDFREELEAVESEEEAVEIQARLQEASVELISEHGWSLDEYNQIARAINTQPETLERALELINEKI
jgi:hypothetical protein